MSDLTKEYEVECWNALLEEQMAALNLEDFDRYVPMPWEVANPGPLGEEINALITKRFRFLTNGDF